MYSLLAYSFIYSVVVFPRAYGGWKALLLGVFLFAILVRKVSSKRSGAYFRVYSFFIWLILINAVALIFGLVNGNSLLAIADGLRLGVIFPLILAFLWEELLHFDAASFISKAMTFSGIFIFAIILLTLAQDVTGIRVYPESFVKENLLNIGVHDGYVQVTSHNVGSLFFIFGYLLYYLISSRKLGFRRIEVVAFVCVLLAALISGRRALLLTIAISPLLVYISAGILNELSRVRGRIYIVSGFMGGAIFLIGVYLVSSGYIVAGDLYERLSGAFVDDGGARTSQFSSLIAGFLEYPAFGSGIGGEVDVVRNFDKPWMYELTYAQVLFNYGLFGLLMISAVFLFKIREIYIYTRNNTSGLKVEDKSLLCGILCLMFGASTNPYLGSFDFMLFLGVFPYLAQRMRQINVRS